MTMIFTNAKFVIYLLEAEEEQPIIKEHTGFPVSITQEQLKVKLKPWEKNNTFLFIDSCEEDHTILRLMEIKKFKAFFHFEITLIWVGLGAF